MIKYLVAVIAFTLSLNVFAQGGSSCKELSDEIQKLAEQLMPLKEKCRANKCSAEENQKVQFLTDQIAKAGNRYENMGCNLKKTK